MRFQLIIQKNAGYEIKVKISGKQTLLYMTEETFLPFSQAFKTAWQEWLLWRKEMRFKKYAPIGLKKTLTHLVAISDNDEATAIAIINQSIIQNWQGLFPLRNNGNATNNTSNAAHKRGTSEARIEALKQWGNGI